MTQLISTPKAARIFRLAASALLTAALAPAALAADAAHVDSSDGANTASASRGPSIGIFEGKSQTDKEHGTSVPNGASEMGWGWAATDDRRIGGQSTASVALVHPGADGSKGALQVTGELKSGSMAPWAGTIWFPGSQPMQPADLSGKKDLSFWVRGTPGDYSLMLMAGSARNIPTYGSFTVTKDWKQVHISLDRYFHYADMQHVYFVAFSVGAPGKFQFELDNVELH